MIVHHQMLTQTWYTVYSLKFFYSPMKLSFYGAAQEVTGSCYMLQSDNVKILIDCGMFQGSEEADAKNCAPFPFDPKEIHAVFVTHAHLDHTGRLPKLSKDGFTEDIYATEGTSELMYFMWDDAAKIMAYNERKHKITPAYRAEDVERAAALRIGVTYRKPLHVGPFVITFHDAGHIFGSSFLEITAEGKTIVFSGDLGNSNVPILRETDQLGNADVLIIESTYGDRTHEGRRESSELLLKLITDAAKRGGTIMIPAFSLERTQEILYDLNRMSEYDKTLPNIPVFLDSPLAIRSLEVYRTHPEYYDREAESLAKAGDDFLQFPQLTITETTEDSKRINTAQSPKLIIAGSGMMTGGRILHHAMRYLPDPRSTLIIVGYQAEGTLGRSLFEGAKEVKIYEQTIPVRCTIHAIGGLSAHGDKEKLLSWARNTKDKNKPTRIFCTHGEITSANALANLFKEELGIIANVPKFGETVEL